MSFMLEYYIFAQFVILTAKWRRGICIWEIMNNYFSYLVPFSSLSLLIWFIISFISFVCTNDYVYVAWNLRSVYRNETFIFSNNLNRMII